MVAGENELHLTLCISNFTQKTKNNANIHFGARKLCLKLSYWFERWLR